MGEQKHAYMYVRAFGFGLQGSWGSGNRAFKGFRVLGFRALGRKASSFISETVLKVCWMRLAEMPTA